MKRTIYQKLKEWKDDPDRVPLLIRGARQVGKSWLITEFGQESFDHLVVADFEIQPELENCFHVLEPKTMIERLEFYLNQPIVPGKTLLFLDEIQKCPRAITSMRYFKEKKRDLHVIAAGSFLEFVINDDDTFSFPVGRLEFLYMRPLSFVEFLQGTHKVDALNVIKTVTLGNPIGDKAHKELLNLVRQFFFVGGMPEVVDIYARTGSLEKCQAVLNRQIDAYIEDFGKYGKHANPEHLRRLFEKIPECVGKRFKYSKIDPQASNPARDYKLALSQLKRAGLVHQIYDTRANGIPLQLEINEKKFRTLCLDIGMMQTALQVDIKDIGSKSLLHIHEGSLAEQFVGQELLAYSNFHKNKKLYYWEVSQRGGAMEVDYVTTINSRIVPIEVKAGITGRLRSLQHFLERKQQSIGIRVSQRPLAFERNILSIPFYLISQLPKLLFEVEMRINA